MNDQQQRQERQEQERKVNQADASSYAEQFSMPLPTIFPLSILTAALIFTMTALVLWGKH